MTEQENWTNEAAIAWSAYRGYRTYQATGDARVGAQVGLATYGGVYLLGVGACFIFIGLLFGIFWPPFLLISVGGAGLAAWGWSGLSKARQTYKAVTSGQYQRVPPPVPEAELPPTGYIYGYDLATGRFTRTERQPELRRATWGEVNRPGLPKAE